MRTVNALLIIDPQKDFTVPGAPLYVQGAEADCQRTADFIRKNVHSIDKIFVTLDSHHKLDISHGCFWQDKNGKPAPAHTLITYADITSGKWNPRPDVNQGYAREYVRMIEEIAANEISAGIPFPILSHYIWPDHCLIGSPGAAIDDAIRDAIYFWEEQTGIPFHPHTKGTNPYTEHFGAFEAQVPISTAPETQLDMEFIQMVETYDVTLACGQARSHCFATTLKQAIYKAPTLAKKFVIMTDCMSNVVVPGGPDFGAICQPIYDKAAQIGIRFEKSTDIKLASKPQAMLV